MIQVEYQDELGALVEGQAQIYDVKEEKVE